MLLAPVQNLKNRSGVCMQSESKTFASKFCFVIAIILSVFNGLSNLEANDPDRPNILWLSTEDIGPQLGCYGDPDAVTPNLDAFAKSSMLYEYAWSNYPVCAPARTTIISGMYAASNSAGNMRSGVVIPDNVKLFPKYLREAGYYCTNRAKEDYNFQGTGDTWDQSSKKAHYKNRADDQPFFAVFNYTGTHESKIRKRPHKQVIDPATVHLTKYWPDTPEVRADWAQYHDNITVMDKWFQKHLNDLEKAGLADNTIVVFFGDHGSGMPRHKRFAGDSGMRVPFIVHVPEKYKSMAGEDYLPGAKLKRPVGFIDLAPTMLSVAGIKPPSFMQGHAFLGEFQAPAPQYLYGLRDRMDERPDVSRSLRDDRYIYVRNYNPHVPAGQYIGYQQQTDTTSVWKRMFDEGKLNKVQSAFWELHPAEELYDLEKDPDETVNLVDSADHQNVLARFRSEHKSSMLRFGDLGLIPEAIAFEFANAKKSRRKMLDDKKQFPLEEIFEIANVAANPKPGDDETLSKAMKHESATIRYWGALGVLIDGNDSFLKHRQELTKLVDDHCVSVSIVAAEACVKFGEGELREKCLNHLFKNSDLRESNYYAAIRALNAIDRLEIPKKDLKSLYGIPFESPIFRSGTYVKQLLKDVVGFETR